MIGKISVIGFVLPETRNFTTGFQNRIMKWRHGDNDLYKEEVMDKKLLSRFLQKVKRGINIYTMVHHPHTYECTLDACEIGIRGYAKGGIFLWFILPQKWQGKLVLNILEYIASIFIVKFDLKDTPHSFPVLSTRLNSTTADLCMTKSSFDSNFKVYTKCDRHLGFILLDANVSLSSYWIEGELNPFDNFLSSNIHLSNL